MHDNHVILSPVKFRALNHTYGFFVATIFPEYRYVHSDFGESGNSCETCTKKNLFAEKSVYTEKTGVST